MGGLNWSANFGRFFKGVFALTGAARKRKNTLSPAPLGAKCRTRWIFG